MIDKKSKFGFTLVELMVVMLFVTLVIAAAAPIITKRVKDVPRKLQHGKYICYRNAEDELREDYYNSSKYIRTVDPKTEGRDQCRFTPPTKASLYRIELIGAGAGGYDYASVTEETKPYRGVYYPKDGSYGGEHLRDLEGKDLYEILYGASYTFHVSTGSGGKGGDIKVFYPPTTGTIFKLYGNPAFPCHGYDINADEKDLPEECVNDLNRIRMILSSISRPNMTNNADAICNGAIYMPDEYGVDKMVWSDDSDAVPRFEQFKQRYSACRGYMDREQLYRVKAYNDALEYYDARISESDSQTSLTANGSSGGGGKLLHYTGTINFKKSSSESLNAASGDGEIKQYLKDLLSGTNYIKKGSVSTPGACGAAFSSTKPTNGISGSDMEWTQENGEKHKEIKAKDGAGVDRYAAIQLFNDVCVSTTKLPTGGKGASVRVNDFQIWYKTACNYSGKNPSGTTFGNIDACNKPGEPAEEAYVSSGNVTPYGGIFEVTNSSKDTTPIVRIYSNLNVRKHEVGDGGTAGVPRKYYAITLADDCIFTVPAGGPLLKYENTENEKLEMEQNLNTSISCNAGSLNFSAEGGKYRKTTTPAEYEPFGARKTGGKYVTTALGDNSVFRSTDDMFTRYNINNRYNFGAAGRGAKIIDACTEHYGDYTMQVEYSSSDSNINGNKGKQKLVHFDREHPCITDLENQESSDVKTEDAQKGQGGAIIISW